MISWGIVSAAFAFIPSIAAATGVSNEGVFYTLRLLLGAFEAGFFPGIIFYLTLWFPALYRARVISYFMLATVRAHAGDPNLVDRGGTDLRVIAQRVWLGTGRLAMAIRSRGVAIGSSGILRVVLFDRFSAPGTLAAERRNCVAGERASNREKKQGEG